MNYREEEVGEEERLKSIGATSDGHVITWEEGRGPLTQRKKKKKKKNRRSLKEPRPHSHALTARCAFLVWKKLSGQHIS